MKTILVSVITLGLALACNRADRDSASHSDEGAERPGAMVRAEIAEPPPAAESKPKLVSVTSSSPQATELFRQGRELQENYRFPEAAKKLASALELDPDLALAHVHLAELSRGEERQQHLAAANGTAAKLPPAEKLMVQAGILKAKGDWEGAYALSEELTRLAPGDWRVRMMQAYRAQGRGDIDGAIAAYEKAISLNPEAAQPHNHVAYMYAEKGNFDRAIAAVSRYAELKPGEPNPLDSKGEILLMAGKFEESEAAFRQALQALPSFHVAHSGIAAARLHAGDSAGAIAELQAARDAAPDAHSKREIAHQMAWACVAAGHPKHAYETLAQLEGDGPEDAVSVALSVAEVALETGDLRQTRKQAARALSLASKANDAMVSKKAAWALVVKLQAELAAGDLPAANKTLARIDDAGKTAGPKYGTAISFAHGAIAAARGDLDAATKRFEDIHPKTPMAIKAKQHYLRALVKAGEHNRAAEIKRHLTSTYRRDFYHAAVRKQILAEGDS